MQARLVHRKTRGQSIPLIAVMLTLLFGMVAVAVDVGTTYAEQRNIVRGTNAASLAAMNKLITGASDREIISAIEESLESNRIPVTRRNQATGELNPAQAGDRTIEAFYLDSAGSPLANCSRVGSCGSLVPSDAKYIEVNVAGTVNTYFARLFGFDELPADSVAYATKGFCNSGFYPLAVRYADESGGAIIDDERQPRGFVNYDGFYTDETYTERLTVKRVYLRSGDNATSEGALLRWSTTRQQNGSLTHLEQMLGGDGNIADGFERVIPWPQIPQGPAAPDGYDRRTGPFQTGDWVYGNYFESGAGNQPFQGVAAAQLQYHKQNRTLMTLPLYRYQASLDGDSTNNAYYVEGIGSFLLVDYGYDNDANLPNGPWVDLAYVGVGGQCSFLVTDAPTTDRMDVLGTVSYLPRYRASNDDDRPLQIVVVLDVSGSMSWNFAGQGVVNGQVTNCAADGAATCLSGPNSRWPTQEERRIFTAKTALEEFVREMRRFAADNPAQRGEDVMQLVTFTSSQGRVSNRPSGDNVQAVETLTRALPASGWSNNEATLLSAIQDAGSTSGDPFVTNGSTPSAVGLARARQVFDNAPDRAPSGRQYRRVLIFMTDGVANVLRDGRLNDTNGCAAEVVDCQRGTLSGGLLAPIDAMIAEGSALKDDHITPTGGSSYVVALGQIATTGMDSISTDPVISAESGASLERVLASIQTDAVLGTCNPAEDPVTNTMRLEDVGSGTPPQGFDTISGNQPGFVTLQNVENPAQRFTVPVVIGTTGQMSYEVQDVPRGMYTLSSWIGFRHPEDGIARAYDTIRDGIDLSPSVTLNVSSTSGDLGGRIVRNLTLDLAQGVSVCASELIQ
jgi:hypothetical protein